MVEDLVDDEVNARSADGASWFVAADPACPGFRYIIMTPIPDKSLGSVKAEIIP